MNIQLSHEKLSKALLYASRAVSQKPNIPVLANVLVEVDEGQIKFSSTNLDMGIVMWIPGAVESSGSTTVNAKYISDFVSATLKADSTVLLQQVDNQVLVNTSKSKAEFSIIPSDEYPVMPKVSEKKLFSISAKEFAKSLNKVLFSCSTDLSAGRLQQTGVLFDFYPEQEEIHFVGLDGYRLSRRISKVNEIAKPEKEFIIVPARYLGELIKILSDYSPEEQIAVSLSESGSQIIFKFDDIEFSIRLLEGPYPDYKKILPDTESFQFNVDKTEFDSALKIISSFARGTLGNKVMFDLDVESSKAKFYSSVSNVGQGETEMVVTELEAESDLNTAYVLRQLQDVINHIDGQIVHFASKGPIYASVLTDSEDSNFLHLIMPVRRD